MKIESLSPLLLTPNPKSMEFNKTSETSFTQWVAEKITTTNNQLNEADQALNQLASGHAENLHYTMITLEKAKLSFQYLEQIRNRLMGAYQDLLREQI